MHGNGFVYIERDELGEPARLWLATCGRLRYDDRDVQLDVHDGSWPKNQVAIPRRDVLHFPNTFREQNGFWGISTLQYAFDTLSLIKTESRQALEMAAKGGREADHRRGTREHSAGHHRRWTV
jgi:Phage portal protein.